MTFEADLIAIKEYLKEIIKINEEQLEVTREITDKYNKLTK
jgi:hypothetical protein